MNIIETTITDINIENIDLAKVELSNKIINNVSPLLNEVYINNADKINKLTIELKEKKKKVLKDKDELEFLLNIYKRKQKVKKLIERVKKLVSSGLVEGQSKKEIIVLLKVIDKLPDDKLDYHLKNTMNIIQKRFS